MLLNTNKAFGGDLTILKAKKEIILMSTNDQKRSMGLKGIQV